MSAAEPSRSSSRRSRFERVDAAVNRFFVRRSLALLRWSVGVIFIYFGALKLVPGHSPAESLVRETIKTLTFGLVTGRVGVAFTGALECTLGVMLLTGWLRRLTIYVLGLELVGILAPLVLLPRRLFDNPFQPTLEGQYVLKDLILAAAAMVLASTIRGGQLVTGEEAALPSSVPGSERPVSPDDKTRMVLESIRSAHSSTDAARAHGITPQEFRIWRDELLDVAVANMAASEGPAPDDRPRLIHGQIRA